MKIFNINKNPLITVTLLFLLSFVFRMWDITKQFEVWDETATVRVGEIQLDYFRSGDFSKESWSLINEHPPFSKYLFGSTRIVSMKVPYFRDIIDQDYPMGRRYTFQRITSAFIASISVLLVFLLARRFYDEKVGVLAALTLSFTPYFIAHSKVATQENLVSFLTLLATLLFFYAIKTQSIFNKLYILSGVTLGLAIATKYNAVFFLLLFFILTIVNFKSIFKKDLKNIFKNRIILIPIISFAVLYVLWPWLWPDPVGRFIESISRVEESRYLEYFLGQFPSHHPWYYFFVYFFATTPPVILFGVILFALKMIFQREKYDLWFMLYFLTPFLSVISPLKMDGIRYIFTIYPALGIVNAIGYYWLIKTLKKFTQITFHQILDIAIPAIVVITLIFTAILDHPYYWDYYNVFVGGPKNVYEKRLFDFGYWGEGLRKGFAFLYEEAKDDPKTVYLKIAPNHVVPPIKDNLKDISEIERADYVIITPTGEWLDQIGLYLEYDFPEHFELVYEDGLSGTSVVSIYKRIEPYTGKIETETNNE